MPLLSSFQGTPHFLVEHGILLTGFQYVRFFSKCLYGIIAAGHSKSRVNILDGAVQIGDEYGAVDLLHHTGEFAQLNRTCLHLRFEFAEDAIKFQQYEDGKEGKGQDKEQDLLLGDQVLFRLITKKHQFPYRMIGNIKQRQIECHIG